MRTRLVTVAAVLGVTAAGTVAVTSAGAAVYHGYYGYAGGSMVRAADATITSDLSVQSTVFAIDANASNAKHTANLTAAGLLSAAAVSTASKVQAVTGGREVVSTTRTAGVNLLSGAITADAVTSTTKVGFVNGKPTSSVSTSFAGLHIAGVRLPVTIPQNYTVSIPGIATVVLNLAQSATSSTAAVGYGSGLYLTLLKSADGNAPGSTVYLSPTYGYTAAGNDPGTGHVVAGSAYGTSVTAKATSAAAVTSDPTASTSLSPAGTQGKTSSSNVAGVNVPAVLTTGGVTSAVWGSNTKAGADARTTAKLAHLSLLGGLISADAVTASARAYVTNGHKLVTTASSSLANLVIAGKRIPLTVKANTTLSLGKLGKVVLNEQVRSGTTVTVRALHITLSTAGYGLNAGAQITVAYATAAAA